MRIIDKTPLLEEDGSISLVNRIQGTLQNGFSWYGNLQAQAQAVAFFEKQLDKNFTLIRNHTLGASKITIPFTLIGPPGAYVFTVTNLEGTYRAKGSNWGKIDGDKYKEASINLLKRAVRFSKAVDLYLEKQGYGLPKPSTPILMALSPRIHIETIRPAVRIVMSDALDRFAVELRQSPPIMVVGDVHQVSEALISPLRKKEAPAPSSVPVTSDTEETEQAVQAYDLYGENQPQTTNNSVNDLGFSFDDDEAPTPTAAPARPRPAVKKPRRKAPQKGLFGMTTKQLIILAVMAGFAALFLIVIIIAALVTL